MKRGKYETPRAAKYHNSKKGLAALLSLVLVIGCVIGGTLAWLTDTTDPVTNTFTIGDINLMLKESPYNANGTYGIPVENVENSYPLLPGSTYKKDPFVTVTANSEDCYLFVKVTVTDDIQSYLTYTLNLTETNGWKSVPNEDDVYYREVARQDEDQTWYLIAGNDTHDTGVISVKDTIVKKGAASDGFVDMPDVAPELTFTAYAVQQANLTVQQAWDLVKN